MEAGWDTQERRRAVRITLIGAARVGSRTEQRAVSAVLNNANRAGAGFHAKESLIANEPVTVCFAFLDHRGEDHLEKLAGRIAWVKPWEKGYLIGVVWDHLVAKDTSPWLASFLEYSLQQTA
ncbi:MAG: PilZ domain-containing protein [Nitrospiraceae bacterium]